MGPGGCGYLDAAAGAAVAAGAAFLVTRGWLRRVWASIRGEESPELRRAKELFFLGKDMNKPSRVMVPRFGGVWSSLAAAIGILVLEACHVYLGGGPAWLAETLSVSLLVLLGAFVGLVDDMMGWKIGVPIRYRLLGSLAAALPLAVVKAGTSVVSLPLLGRVDLGMYYSLVLVPVGVMGAANAFNMLAGYNGLEAGMASLLLATYAAYGIHKGTPQAVLAAKLAIIGLSAVLAWLPFNWYPARTFPGNAFTYSFGAFLAAVVIIGNYEKVGVEAFLLYFLELALFLRGLKDGVYKENFGVPRGDGSLAPPYPKVYSVTHLAIVVLEKTRGRATERGVVALILILQALISLVVLALNW